MYLKCKTLQVILCFKSVSEWFCSSSPWICLHMYLWFFFSGEFILYFFIIFSLFFSLRLFYSFLLCFFPLMLPLSFFFVVLLLCFFSILILFFFLSFSYYRQIIPLYVTLRFISLFFVIFHFMCITSFNVREIMSCLQRK